MSVHSSNTGIFGSRRRPAWWLVGAGALVCGAIAAGAVATLRSAGPSTELAATIAVPGAQGRPGREAGSLEVFRAGRTGADRLPATVARPAGVAPARTDESRLLLADGAARLYAWPAGDAGFCLGLAGLASHCVDTFAQARPVGPTIVASDPADGVWVAGLLADEVVAVTVQGDGASCPASLGRNGFLCALPPGTPLQGIALRVRTRDGREVTLPAV